jgi:chemotaxis protein methyltransferase CheR
MTVATLSPAELLDDPFFDRLKSHVIDVTGLACYATQTVELARHLLQRLTARELTDCCDYWNLIHDGNAGEAEFDLLIANLTIGETFFFRHEEQFNSLRDWVLPEIIERNRSIRRLRIWSAGCATGAEPYSVAILLKQQWGDVLSDWDVSIVGTDINRSFIAQARQGVFGDWALRTTSEPLRTACFQRSGEHWLIRPEFRQAVSFRHHNLVQDSFPSLAAGLSAFDLILCRNVMIYFDQETNRRIVGQFHACLAEFGWLMVGHAECQNEWFPQFRIVNGSESVLYQKLGANGVSHSCPVTQATRIDTSAAWPTPPQSGSAYATDQIVAPSPIAHAAPGKLASVDGSPRRDAWELAAEQCQEQLAAEPLNPQFHFDYASLLEQRGRYREAELALRRTLYLSRDFVLAHFDLGRLLRRRGDLQNARRCFRNALRLLEMLDPRTLLPSADGMDAAALAEAIRTHLEPLDHT